MFWRGNKNDDGSGRDGKTNGIIDSRGGTGQGRGCKYSQRDGTVVKPRWVIFSRQARNVEHIFFTATRAIY